MIENIQIEGDERKRFMRRAFEIYQATYSTIGAQFTNSDFLLSESSDWELSLDKDEILALMLYKRTSWGLKAIALATNQSMPGKHEGIRLLSGLNRLSYYGELSINLVKFIDKFNLIKIPVSRAQRILNKTIVPVDNYFYLRSIANLPELKQKIMVGNVLDK